MLFEAIQAILRLKLRLKLKLLRRFLINHFQRVWGEAWGETFKYISYPYRLLPLDLSFNLNRKVGELCGLKQKVKYGECSQKAWENYQPVKHAAWHDDDQFQEKIASKLRWWHERSRQNHYQSWKCAVKNTTASENNHWIFPGTVPFSFFGHEKHCIKIQWCQGIFLLKIERRLPTEYKTPFVCARDRSNSSSIE